MIINFSYPERNIKGEVEFFFFRFCQRNYFYCLFFNSRDHPGTSYYLSENAVNIHNSTEMAELLFHSTPPSLYKLKFSLGFANRKMVTWRYKDWFAVKFIICYLHICCFKLGYATMIFVRAALSLDITTQLQKAITIAIR